MEARTIRLMEQAGMSLRPNEWLLIRVCTCVTSVALLWLLFTWWIGIPAGVVLGLLGTRWYRTFRTSRRTQQFAEQLPDAMQLVVGSLKSGFSLGQSVDALVREAADPVAAEFGRALAESRLGAELEDALDRAAVTGEEPGPGLDRDGCPDPARGRRQPRRGAADLGGHHAGTRPAASPRQGALGRGTLSAWVLLALPIGLAIYMYLVRRSTSRSSTPNPWGSSCCSDRSCCWRSAGSG